MIGAGVSYFLIHIPLCFSHGVRIWRAGKLRAWKLDVINQRKYNTIEKYILTTDPNHAISECTGSEKNEMKTPSSNGLNLNCLEPCTTFRRKSIRTAKVQVAKLMAESPSHRPVSCPVLSCDDSPLVLLWGLHVSRYQMKPSVRAQSHHSSPKHAPHFHQPQHLPKPARRVPQVRFA